MLVIFLILFSVVYCFQLVGVIGSLFTEEISTKKQLFFWCIPIWPMLFVLYKKVRELK